MSEAITKVCYGCAGMKTVPRGDVDVRGKGPVMCPDCSGTGRVPDVEATLRAEVARLTNERDAWRGSSARWAEDCTRLTAEVERFRASFELQGKEVSRLTVALDEMVDESRSVARDHNHLTAEVGRLTNQNGALMAQAQEDIRVLGYAVDKNLALSIENERLTAEVERLSQREPTQQECDAAEGKPDSEGNTWPDGEVFLGTTCRRCIDCGRWAFGGPTRCLYCAGKYDATVTGQMYLDDLRATKAEVERLSSRLKSAEEVVVQARQLGAYSWEDRLDDSRVSDDAKQDARELEIAVWHYDRHIKTEGAVT